VPKEAKKVEKKAPPQTTLESLGAQIQKLAKNLANPKDKEKFLDLKERYYREFLNKINKSNSIETKFPTSTFPPYKYYVGRGNNSILVRACLKTRFWWSMGDLDDWGDYNFLWTQWKSNKILDCIKPFKEKQEIEKQKEKQREGGDKANDSLLSTQPTDKESSSSVENLITTPKRSNKTALSALKKTASSINSSGNKHGSATNFRVGGLRRFGKDGDKDEDKEENPTSHSLIISNHQENNFHLSNKKAIYYNMKIYYESTG